MSESTSRFSASLIGLGYLLMLGSGLYGLILMIPDLIQPAYRFFESYIGYIAILPMIFVLPLLVGLGPFYLLIVKGYYLPLVFTYLGWVPLFIAYSIADRLSNVRRKD